MKFLSGLKVFEVNKLTSNTFIKQVNDFLELFEINISHDKPSLPILLCVLSINGL